MPFGGNVLMSKVPFRLGLGKLEGEGTWMIRLKINKITACVWFAVLMLVTNGKLTKAQYVVETVGSGFTSPT